MYRAILVVVPLVALGQMVSPPAKSVSINGPVGVTVQLPDGGTQILQVEGRGGGPILVIVDGVAAVDINNIPTVALQNGTQVGLSSATLNLIAGQRNCINYPIGNNVIDGGVFSVPAASGQTGLSVTAHAFGASVDYVACWPAGADGGPLPSCVIGPSSPNIPVHNQGNLTLDGISSSTVLKCTACTHTGGPPSGGTALLGGHVSACSPL